MISFTGSQVSSGRFLFFPIHMRFGKHVGQCLWLGCLILSLQVLATSNESSAHGQGKTEKKKPETPQKEVMQKGANTKIGKAAKGGVANGATAEKPLEAIDFEVAHRVLLEDGAVKDLDETAAGKKRLSGVVERTKEIFEKRKSVDMDRRPLVLSRDKLLGEVVLLNQAVAQTQQGIQQLQIQIRNLNAMLNNNNNLGNVQNIRNQIQANQDQIALGNALILDKQEEIGERTPEINALNLQIVPLDAELLKLWTDLNDCRRQWLEVRQPQQKYAHGNYEGLKQSIGDWVLLDSLWPEAFCWAALCHYELGEYQEAWDNVERAAELRVTLRLAKPWAQGDALRGLVAAKLPDRRGKASNFLLSAGTAVSRDKSTSWVVLFLLGRAACENEKLEAKAKTYFERSLKTRTDSPCVKYWLGRLQCTSTTATVRDAETGIKTLEELWNGSTKKSWRLAYQMVLAYDGAKRDSEAKATWELVETLGPKKELERLQADREVVRTKLSSATDDEPKSKTKANKSLDKAAE